MKSEQLYAHPVTGRRLTAEQYWTLIRAALTDHMQMCAGVDSYELFRVSRSLGGSPTRTSKGNCYEVPSNRRPPDGGPGSK
jgi:hypothetical protein